MPDKRLIDANALDLVPDIHNAMNGVIFVNHPRGGGRTQMIVQQLLTRMISNAPTIDAVEVVHARWRMNKKFGDYECTACGQGDIILPYFKRLKLNYCPFCGAKMDAKEDKPCE